MPLATLDIDSLLYLFLLVFVLVALALEVICILTVQLGLLVNRRRLVRHVLLLGLHRLFLIRVLNGHVGGVDVFLKQLLLARRLIQESIIDLRRRQHLYTDTLLRWSVIVSSIVSSGFRPASVDRICDGCISIVILFLHLLSLDLEYLGGLFVFGVCVIPSSTI